MAAVVELFGVTSRLGELEAAAPLTARISRKLKALDRAEYWLVELDRPVRVDRSGGLDHVRYLLLWPENDCMRHDGGGKAVSRTGIDLVTDDSLLAEEVVDFGKSRPVGIGCLRLLRPEEPI